MIRHITVKKKNGAPDISKSANKFFSSEELNISHGDFHDDQFFQTIGIQPGIKMILANHGRCQQFQMNYEIERAPVSFCYTISQRIKTTMTSGTRKKCVVERSPGEGALAYLPKTRGTTSISWSGRAVGVSLHFCTHTFYELFNKLPQCLKELSSVSGDPTGKRFYQQSRFNEKTHFVLKQILECPYKGETQRLYFESKALELVALKLAELEQSCFSNIPDTNRKDLDRAREAYHILLSNIDHPPSLIGLSRLVGTNRNKLNQGFKAIYGDTVFNVLRNARLSKAWSLLKQTNLSLSEIALSVGYNNQSNFTTAFRKQFGKTPKTVRQDILGDPFPPDTMI